MAAGTPQQVQAKGTRVSDPPPPRARPTSSACLLALCPSFPSTNFYELSVFLMDAMPLLSPLVLFKTN